MGAAEFVADPFGESKVVGVVEEVDTASEIWLPPSQWLERFAAEYGGHHDGNSETLPPGCDAHRAALAIFTMNEDASVKTLGTFIDGHEHDYTLDKVMLQRYKELVQGNEACAMEYDEWAYVTCKTAGLVQNWSPYAEVRAVTLPYDDPEEACESLRAYLLGFFWVCICTAVNTCESPSPPSRPVPSRPV